MDKLNQNETDLRESYDKLADTYDEVTGDLGHEIVQSIKEHHLSEVLLSLKNPKILDSGGGTGKWSLWLAQKGYEVTLLDISPKSLEVAKKKAEEAGVNFPIIEGNAEDTSLSSQAYDLILAFGTISYTPDPDKLLLEINRLLRPGGIVCVEYFNSLGWANAVGDLDFKLDLALADQGWFTNPTLKYPERAFSNKYMEEILNNHGFNIVRKVGYGIINLSLPENADRSNPIVQQQIEKIKSINIEVSKDESCFGTGTFSIVFAKKGS